jgi:hypothetical protein
MINQARRLHPVQTIGLIILGSSVAYLLGDAIVVFFTHSRVHDRPWHRMLLIAAGVGAVLAAIGTATDT